MQRSKACVSVEVKQVIGALCRLLGAAGLDAVPAPETFRRAKFGGGNEVESQFWQLHANILQRSGVFSTEASAQLKGDLELRKLVAAGLWQTGFHADWMYRRKEGEEAGGEEGRSFSSRDLLLALGWLLATGTLEKLLTQRVQQLDKTLLASLPMNTQVGQGLSLDLPCLRRLQWLNGSLRHQGRILLSMLEERSQLLHSVFSASLPSTAPASSDQSSTALKDDCVRMQQLCGLLEAYLGWKQVEKVFWTWMDSVVDCHQMDPVVKRSICTPNVCHHGNKGLEKLDDMLLRLLTTQAHRVRLQVERPVRHGTCPAESHHNRAETPHELPASQAAQLLLQTETLLLQRRDKQRLASRMQLQETIGGLDELVLIPP